MSSCSFHDDIMVPGKRRVVYAHIGESSLQCMAVCSFGLRTSRPGSCGNLMVLELQSVTACPGIFGARVYPEYPGDLKVDKVSNASHNAYGAGTNKFLLPAVWDPLSLDCRCQINL
ncbi:EXORDIUM like 2 [Melia azedarach]|uniref:EXORDIUM like 2 n=1 Tax=Melia azedarach TaxID=155640 RepID=A0ACC1YW72_MELAZ|nr:EXORDIUM like 2 [Melia azedarach]